MKIKGRTVDMSDIEADPVVQFQRKFYVPLYLFLRILMPLVIPCYYWGEILHYSVIGLFAQYIGALHATWFVNSGEFISVLSNFMHFTAIINRTFKILFICRPN